MRITWKRHGREVWLYGMHKNAVGAMNLLRLNAPGMEVRALDNGKEITIPIRELDFDFDHVRESNPSIIVPPGTRPMNDNGYDGNGTPT